MAKYRTPKVLWVLPLKVEKLLPRPTTDATFFVFCIPFWFVFVFVFFLCLYFVLKLVPRVRCWLDIFSPMDPLFHVTDVSRTKATSSFHSALMYLWAADKGGGSDHTISPQFSLSAITQPWWPALMPSSLLTLMPACLDAYAHSCHQQQCAGRYFWAQPFFLLDFTNSPCYRWFKGESNIFISFCNDVFISSR